MKAPKRKQRIPGTTAKQKAKKGKGLNKRILELEAEARRKDEALEFLISKISKWPQMEGYVQEAYRILESK